MLQIKNMLAALSGLLSRRILKRPLWLWFLLLAVAVTLCLVFINPATVAGDTVVEAAHTPAPSATVAATKEASPVPGQLTPGAQEPQDYVLNKNTKKFHLPECSSVRQILEKNRLDTFALRGDIISDGFAPCKICKP